MEDLKISKRLQKVASLVKQGNVVADIGTDHGYLPIYIVKNGVSDKVIAMDVRKGPLQKAVENVASYGVKDNIDIRLSDGLEKLSKNEADTITICGMGGRLIQSILEKGKSKYNAKTQLIVSPQSEIRDFRKYLLDEGFHISGEYMLREEGQFYLIIDCFYIGSIDNNICDLSDDLLCETHLRYGKMLLESRCPCLYEYMQKERQTVTSVLEKIESLRSDEDAVLKRISQLQRDIECLDRAQKYYE
ncbi:MAG: SAM-dependent methyltransferase [Lachnospira sp.]|nr:SAM-dependent methyltransferase [Lachnospira sp.]